MGDFRFAFSERLLQHLDVPIRHLSRSRKCTPAKEMMRKLNS
ncbi:hypothetical protein CPter91_4041 [Collimonas pratensis]|uniref:Uncharacterized protein n=1 Tax=Collimonas pratensis TaxID=279113 RepID=A0A127Q8N9_9BURK|nr:hypothetical protein CPter91_4041 [Collimonas pratensis]